MLPGRWAPQKGNNNREVSKSCVFDLSGMYINVKEQTGRSLGTDCRTSGTSF